MDWLPWVGIAVCLLQSAVFSGLNLALFGVSRLTLEIEAEGGNRMALQVIGLRADSNFLLTTILWGNVSVNCLLTLLSDSVLAGVAAFAFSTVGITFVGEIIPQAYFSRNALRMGSLLAPVIRFYQKLFYPVAKPTAKLLDLWLGKEGIAYLRERDLRAVIEKHMKADEADLEHKEGIGALNFLTLDDLPLGKEGTEIDPLSVIELPVNVDLPVFPDFERTGADPFVRQVAASGRKWVILTDPNNNPRLVLDSDQFLRSALLADTEFSPYECCHRPLVMQNRTTQIGRALKQLTVHAEHREDDVIDQDLILLWSDQEKRIITGADLLGRLMRGIVRRIDKILEQEDDGREEPAPGS